METCNVVPTPMVKGLKLSQDQGPKTDEEREKMARVPYQSAVGALMYLAMCTRPDILYAVVTLARFMHNPGEAHWSAVKRIFRYLKRTVAYNISYVRNPKDTGAFFNLYGSSDASWVSDDFDTYKSNSGFVMLLADKAISWKSVKQLLTTQSTTEAEYMAACMAMKEVV